MQCVFETSFPSLGNEQSMAVTQVQDFIKALIACITSQSGETIDSNHKEAWWGISQGDWSHMFVAQSESLWEVALQFLKWCLLLQVCILEREMCHDSVPVRLSTLTPSRVLSITEYLNAFKTTVVATGYTMASFFVTAHLEHKLSSRILVNLSFINRIPRAVSLVHSDGRCALVVRDDSMTSKGKTEQQLSHQSTSEAVKLWLISDWVNFSLR